VGQGEPPATVRTEDEHCCNRPATLELLTSSAYLTPKLDYLKSIA
jgi:hypothetical protein